MVSVFVSRIDRCWFIRVTLIKISYIWTLFNVWFIQDSVLFRVRFRQVTLTRISYIRTLFKVKFIQDSALFRASQYIIIIPRYYVAYHIPCKWRLCFQRLIFYCRACYVYHSFNRMMMVVSYSTNDGRRYK